MTSTLIEEVVFSSKRRQRDDVDAEVILFANKLEAFLATGQQLQLKPSCIYEDGIIQMKCVTCLLFDPRKTKFFNAANKPDIFVKAAPEAEGLANSKTNPCKKCLQDIDAKRLATEDGFVSNMLHRYPGLTKVWFYETLEAQNFRGSITNVVMKLTSNQANCVGVHRSDNTKRSCPR